ncbi:MAG: PEP-utilizing enzyme [Candidatus Uhrbacteria bacterium]
MQKIDLAKLYKTQISLSEWFEKIGQSDTEALRLEDNEKRERLNVLWQRLGLPFDRPYKFSAADITSRSPEFSVFLAEHGQELCALRLIPSHPELPKLRLRGQTIEKVLDWFNEQKIDPQQYRADFTPHSESYLWSTIFVINQRGIFGEIICGGHHQLTQGFYDSGQPISFSFDFKDWQFSSSNEEAIQQVHEMINKLKVSNPDDRDFLARELNSTFIYDYLCGYFEATISKEFGLWFIDYNRLLSEVVNNSVQALNFEGDEELHGQIGCLGVARGRVRVVAFDKVTETALSSDEVLVCPMTTPEYLPLMQQAAAIVTDQGGILSHAAIIARELKKPCVVGTKKATTVLHDGDFVEVDAERGIVRLAS